MLLPLVATAVLAGAVLVGGAASAFADYGNSAQYQVEISFNCNGTLTCAPVGQNFGMWLWIELSSGGTGTYQGADCADQTGSPTVPPSGASHDSGDVHWSYSGSNIVITGVTIVKGELPLTLTVPRTYGHYTESGFQLLGFPLSGAAQVTVAP
ncbi:MAG TPA: hypothetical protein VF960_14705 [Chloroflexota bacterium]